MMPQYSAPQCKAHPLITPQSALTYNRILLYSGLQVPSQISFRNVLIYDTEHLHQIYTINNNKNNKMEGNSYNKMNSNNGNELPHLVFLHGFGDTSMVSVRICKYLYNYAQIHALDAYGFGYSSRGNFKQEFTFQQARDYFVQAVQQWRKAVHIQKFYLVGHSFGGYLSTWYSAKYPQHVSHLFLVSPAGTSVNTKLSGQASCVLNIFSGLASKIYKCKIQPSKAMNNFFIGKIVNAVMLKQLKIPQNQQQDWKLYWLNINSQQNSSEAGFYCLFDWPIKPKIYIQDMINQGMLSNISGVDFYFGDQDWMAKQGAQRVTESGLHKGVNFTIVPQAGHQIIFDNPQFLCTRILERIRQYHQK